MHLTTDCGTFLNPLLPLSSKISLRLRYPLTTVVNRHMALIAVTSSIAAMRLSAVSQDVLGLLLDDRTLHWLTTRAISRILDEAAALGELLAVIVVSVHIDPGDAGVAFA